MTATSKPSSQPTRPSRGSVEAGGRAGGAVTPRPVYLRSGSQQLFAMYHAAPAAPERPAVLICGPWGWDETASYRLRHTVAADLAAAGHPTLRFDLPAVGNSSGLPGDPGLLDAWLDAVGDAARWLRQEGGRRSLAVFGIGLGGTLAMAALDRGAEIDELVLWASPESGRHFVREVKTFAMLGADEEVSSEDALPEGWIEAGGFTLSAETVADLKALKPLGTVPPRLRRALLLGRDGVEASAALRARLEESVDVEVGPGLGWEGVVFSSEFPVEPEATIAELTAWLGRSPGLSEGTAKAAAVASAEIFSAEVGGRRIEEVPFTIARPGGSVFAILAEPTGGDVPAPDLCVVYFNGGGVRTIGPNRNWVENARHWAGRGLRSVRVDLDGIGDSSSRRSREDGYEVFFSVESEEGIRSVFDELTARGLGSRFVCVGLCSGAYWAIHMADRDPRVESCVSLNAGALILHAGLQARHQLNSWVLQSLFKPSSWKKLLRFEVNLLEKARIIKTGLGWRLGHLFQRIRGNLGDTSAPEPFERETEALFDRLRDEGKRTAISLCANEPVAGELTAIGVLDQLGRWPNLVYETLPGERHSLASIPAQLAGRALVDRELELALARS